MSTRPLVTISIPVYNCEKFVHLAIESALSQTFQDFEIVIVDNRSTDKTFEVVSSFKDPRIRVLRNDTNIGAMGNWNRVVREARGKYVKLLCADDLIYPSCLERQVAIMENSDNQTVSLVSSRRDVVDSQGKKWIVRGYSSRDQLVTAEKALKKILRCGTNPLGEPAAVLFRREHFMQTSGFDGRIPYMIDLDMWCKLLRLGDLYVIGEPLCAFRMSTGSWSADLALKQGVQARQFFMELQKQENDRLGLLDLLLGISKATAFPYIRQMFYRFQ